MDIKIVYDIGSFLGAYTESSSKATELLRNASAALDTFLVLNFLGPVAEPNPTEDEQSIRDSLVVDGEYLPKLVRGAKQLMVAQDALKEFRAQPLSTAVEGFAAQWLTMRAAVVHQNVLAERCSSLKAAAIDAVNRGNELLKSLPIDEVLLKSMKVVFYVECGYASSIFYEHTLSKQYFEWARDTCGMQLELTGALGRRTRFQQKDVAQLKVTVTWPKAAEGAAQEGDGDDMRAHLPKDLPLRDDTVLDRVVYCDDGLQCFDHLAPLQQLVLLASCYEHQRCHSTDEELISEELMAYIEAILHRPCSYYIHSCALYMRTRLERQSPRRVERSLKQLEELVSCMDRSLPQQTARLVFAYSGFYQPYWTIQKQLGRLLESIGATNAAMQIYEQLDMCEESVRCGIQLGKAEEAVRLLQRRIELSGATPELLCLLGDATDDERRYEEAWALSGQRYGRAMRSLGFFYLRKRRFADSLPALERSLSINPLQTGVWFSYGCAAIASSQFDTAVKAFRRCTTLEYDNFQAWNNLATAFVRQQQLSKALAVMQEAIKCNYEEWRLWENYLLIAGDCCQIDDICRAYHRLLDMRKTYLATDVLQKALKILASDAALDTDSVRAPYRRTVELFARLASCLTLDSVGWRLYADLIELKNAKTASDYETILEYRQKAVRTLVMASMWEQSPDSCKAVLRSCNELLAAFQKYAEQLEADKRFELANSIRLLVRNAVLVRAEKHINSFCTVPETWSSVTEELQLLKTACSNLIEKFHSNGAQ